MKNPIPIAVAFLSLMVYSCGNLKTPDQEAKEDTNLIFEEGCEYIADQAKTKLKWTAFKFTEKVGVSGTFDTFYLVTTANHKGIPNMLTNAILDIRVNSVNSQNSERDGKIKKFFFGSLNNSSRMLAKVVTVDGNNESGKLTTMVTMNDIELPTEMAYRREGDELIITGMIDVNKWNAQSGIANLNEVCKDLHTGSDGVSLLWSEVEIEVRTLLIKTCSN